MRGPRPEPAGRDRAEHLSRQHCVADGRGPFRLEAAREAEGEARRMKREPRGAAFARAPSPTAETVRLTPSAILTRKVLKR